MTLSLGTVQLGLHYGVNNARGALTEDEAQDLLAVAWESGFRMVDTSSEYGLAEERIGRYLRAHPGAFEVVVKYNASYPPETMARLLEQSRRRIGKVDHVMLYTVGGEAATLDPQAAGGVSVYTVEEAEAVSGFKLVSVPGNVLDGRMDAEVKRMQSRGQKVELRSLLLQGLLASDPGIRPAGNTGNGSYIEAAKPYLAELTEAAADFEMTLPEMAVRWSWEIGPDVAIIGCESAHQARQIGEWHRKGSLPPWLADYARQVRKGVPEVVISPRMWGQVYDFTAAKTS